MPGSDHGPSIKNPATYEALKRQGKSKASAAAISNAALNKGYKKGVHHKHKHHAGRSQLARLMAQNAMRRHKSGR